jgi:hypothetical protein
MGNLNLKKLFDFGPWKLLLEGNYRSKIRIPLIMVLQAFTYIINAFRAIKGNIMQGIDRAHSRSMKTLPTPIQGRSG